MTFHPGPSGQRLNIAAGWPSVRELATLRTISQMRTGLNFRLLLLAIALGLLGVSIVAVTVDSQRRASAANERLSQVESESFRIAERFKDRLREVNDRMRRYASFHEPAVWQEFLQGSQELKNWIGQQKPRLRTEAEKSVLTQMDTAYDSYVARAQDLHTLIESSEKTGASLADYNSFFEQSRRLLDLGEALARAHYDSRTELLNEAAKTLTQFHSLVLVLLGLLFIFGLTLAWVVYRDLIAPLRVRLVESQAQAERNEKLASLGVLAAGVAHEIRNPLTAIKTALYMQQRKMPTGSLHRTDSEMIERQVVRLERIVNDFLLFARPAPPAPAEVPVEQPLNEVHSLLAPQLGQNRINLKIDLPERLRVRVDPAQLQQVLINLVQNAADSIGQNGTILLSARGERKRDSNGQPDVVVVEVSDTGKGIAPEVEKRLFDPFFTTKDNGTGLGLSIAARMVELNGGSLQYRTQVNQGSTFGIVLPRVL